MFSSTAMMLNKNKFHFWFFYLTLLLEVRCEFQKTTSLNAESHFCSTSESWTGIGVPHLILISPLLNLPHLTQRFKEQ